MAGGNERIAEMKLLVAIRSCRITRDFKTLRDRTVFELLSRAATHQRGGELREEKNIWHSIDMPLASGHALLGNRF